MKINYSLSNRANKSDLQQKWEFGFSLLALMFCRVKSNIQKLLRNTAIYFRNCAHSFCLHWKMPHLSNFPYSLCYCAWLFFRMQWLLLSSWSPRSDSQWGVFNGLTLRNNIPCYLQRNGLITSEQKLFSWFNIYFLKTNSHF